MTGCVRGVRGPCTVSSPVFFGIPHSVTLDASFVIGLCAREPGKYPKAQAALQQRVVDGCSLHAPHLLVMETAYVLCGKQQAAVITPAEYAAAVANLQTVLTIVEFPAGGDVALYARAEQMRQGYGCSRSADGFYIALAENLAASGPSELLTFDAGQQSQAASVAPIVTVTLLTP